MMMHLACHPGSHLSACDPTLVLPLVFTTMDPAEVTCGNCVRTTLYRTAVRVTEHVAVIERAVAAAVNRGH